LKRKLAIAGVSAVLVAKENPLQQGLKLIFDFISDPIAFVAKENPLQQGLKPKKNGYKKDYFECRKGKSITTRIETTLENRISKLSECGRKGKSITTRIETAKTRY